MRFASARDRLNELQRKFMSRDVKRAWYWYDPKEPITSSCLAFVAHELDLSIDKVQQQYESLAAKLQLDLKMEWQAQS
jgi:hypothetical protein